VRTADVLAGEALVELFNDAYSDYFLPLRLDLAGMQAMVESSDLELASSPLAELGGEPVGVALLGIRGGEGWIGGMGVVPAARRRGIGRMLMEAAIAAARRRGVGVVRLEVLEQNEPAVQLYRQLGFAHERDLDVWSLAGGGPQVRDVEEAGLDEAHAWIAEHRESREPWQRADDTLAHLRRREPAPAALELRGDGAPVGAVVHAGPAVLQLAAADPVVVSTLVAAVRARAGGVRWLNAPAGEAGSAAMEALGATRVARQHELVLELR
jgi:GNAT superfamily N-acetyltransferase